MKFKRKKAKPEIATSSEIKTWDEGRMWLKENGWLLHFYETEYFRDVVHFFADKSINGFKVEVHVEAKSDLVGIKGVVEKVQEYETRSK